MSTLNLLLLAGEAALASLALPVMAGMLARTYPKNAGRRSLVWTTMFAVLLALPLAAALSPTLAVITLPAPALTPLPPTAVEVAPGGSSSSGAADPVMLALSAWGMGALWVIARALAGLAWLERLRFRSAPLPPERLPLALPRRCRAGLSADCLGPITWGALRPTILLPDDALEWPRERLDAALRHELAHVARKDSLIQALALLACALYWPNPLVWRSAAALRREAEQAADDAVIAAGVRPSDYASLLVDLAGEWPSQRLAGFEMAMAAPPILTERVQSILSPDAIRSGATVMDTFKLALLGGVALAGLSLARPSLAESPAASAARTPAAAQPPAVQAPQAAAPTAEARPAPQAVAAAPLPPLPPLPAAPPPFPGAAMAPLPPAPPGAVVVQGRIGGPSIDLRTMTPEQRAELDRKLADIGPTINKAIAEAHIDETVQKALASQDPKTRELVARQLAELGPNIQRAVAAAHIQELVQQRMAQLGPQFQEAMKKARAQAADAEDRAAARLEEEAKRARERAKRDRESQAQPLPAPTPGAFIGAPNGPLAGAVPPGNMAWIQNPNGPPAPRGVPRESWNMVWIPNPAGPAASGESAGQSKN